jgi:hypothetical protein
MQDDRPPTPLEYARHEHKPSYHTPGFRRTIPVLFVLAILLVAIAILEAQLGPDYAREPANRVLCANHLRQLGLAAIMSANQRRGNFPDDLQTIYTENDLGPSMLFCPTTMPSVQYNATTQQAVSAIRAGQASYIYLGKGLRADGPADLILMYESPDDHDGDGINVLFMDDHVEWLNADEAKKLIARIAAGENPVHYPAATTFPATQP